MTNKVGVFGARALIICRRLVQSRWIGADDADCSELKGLALKGTIVAVVVLAASLAMAQSVSLQPGDVEIVCEKIITGARTVLDRALVINPYYVNAWLRLARLHAINSDFDAAYQALDRVAEIDPGALGVRAIRPVIDELASQ